MLAPGGIRRLPEANAARFRNRLRAMADRLRAGTIEPDQVEMRVAAWRAHARTAGGARLAGAQFRSSGVLTGSGKMREKLKKIATRGGEATSGLPQEVKK